MIANTSKRKDKIPANLIYEEMDGKPIYYRGYQSVLNKTLAEGIDLATLGK